MSRGDFIGRGWRFPPKVNTQGGLSWSDGPQRVQDAIWLIVATGLDERLMRPRFGAGVSDYVLQANSAVNRTALADAIKNALVQWEPRIELEGVRVDPVSGEPSQVLVAIDYTLRSTNELFNVVYPLYLEEGVK
jgi:phage baseplate assembly protein W